VFRAAYESEPEAPGTARELARLLARRGDLRSAHSVVNAGLTRRPDDVDLLTFRAVLARLDGDVEEALMSAKAALSRTPFDPGATLELASALTKQKKTTLAATMLARAAEAAPGNARLRFGLAEVARASGDDTRALSELLAAAERDPSDASVQAAIGALALTHRDYARAKAAYASAIALGDDSPGSSQGLSTAMASISEPGNTKEKTQ
jgi:tetratricopeptide (TPR) repeat protein